MTSFCGFPSGNAAAICQVTCKDFIGLCPGLPTAAPTALPTAPTAAPTALPTAAPTAPEGIANTATHTASNFVFISALLVTAMRTF